MAEEQLPGSSWSELTWVSMPHASSHSAKRSLLAVEEVACRVRQFHWLALFVQSKLWE